MKAGVQSRVDTFTQAAVKFAARWEALKPSTDAMSDPESALAAVKIIKERRAEFDTLMETATSIRQDCEHFGVEQPHFEAVDAVAQDLSDTEETWVLYEEFLTGLQVNLNQEYVAC